jgi:SAM-dependent methyltransferase
MYEKGEPYETWWHRERLQRVMFQLGKIRGTLNTGYVLDVGCAEGYYCGIAEQVLGDKVRYVGIDISETYLKKAKRACVGHRIPSHFVLSALEFLPFRDRSFSLVVCSEILEHLPEPERGIDEVIRVSDSWVIITIPGHFFGHSLAERLPFVRNRLRHTNVLVGHVSWIKISELLKWTKRAGGDLIESEFCGIIPPEVFRILHVPLSVVSAVEHVAERIWLRLSILVEHSTIKIVILRKPTRSLACMSNEHGFEARYG